MHPRPDDQNLGDPSALPSVSALLAMRAKVAPKAPVIEAEKARPLSNSDLLRLSDETRIVLRNKGYGPTARIALTAPAGPEFAAAAITISANAVCAPLNPGLGSANWRDMLTQLQIDALVAHESCGPARDAATVLRIPVLDLTPTPEDGAGAFRLPAKETAGDQHTRDEVPGLDDIAFVLPTSGTTSRPKAVQLTHRNIAHSGRNTRAALTLTQDDRLIGVLPIHHAHGLISGLMATLHAGASVIMMRGFSANAFFDHLSRFRPTWLTAVPAIHQAILDAAPDHQAALDGHGLRFIRSASAPLPEARYQALADLFDAPIIETYGMTEAASQVASNPMGVGRQKTGSVGIAAGPEIAILNDNGAFLPPNAVGQVVLRGPNITQGYDDPAATADAFTPDGWFRTGDLGRLDEDGYLFLVGRLKEIINRGGEKIMPQRVEAVLLRHPSIAEAAAFGASHDRLGEEVAVAVVPTKNAEIDETALRTFALASGELSEAETPRLILCVDALPKTVTGKVQRALLANHLGVKRPALLAAETSDEDTLIDIWRDVLGMTSIGATDDFFHLGGDSLMAVEVVLQIAETFNVSLTLRTLFEAPTPRVLAAKIRSAQPDQAGFKIAKAAPGAMQKPVSISQERILTLEASLPGFPTHTVPIVYFVDGPLDAQIFQKALRTLIARHEAFRTIYRKVSGDWKAIPTAAVNLRVEVEDWRWAASLNRDGLINDALESEVWDVLDPTRSPPLRTRLLKFGERSHAMMLIFHHIAMDNWTIRTFVEELFQHYSDLAAGAALSRPRPSYQFADFAAWQRKWVTGTDAAQQREYWKGRLANLPSIFPKEDSLNKPSIGFGAGRAELAISGENVDTLTAAAKASGATLFMGLLAAFKVFLHQKYGCEDIAIVTPTANRTRPATGDVLGLIANNAAIRTNTAAEGFSKTLLAVRDAVLDADAHQELPFETVMDDLATTDIIAAEALSDVYFSLVDQVEPDVADTGLSLSRMQHDQAFETPLPMGGAKLMILVKVVDGAIMGSCIFKPHLLSQEDAQDLMDDFSENIHAIVDSNNQTLVV